LELNSGADTALSAAAKFWFMLVLIGQSPQLEAANRNAARTVGQLNARFPPPVL
jgi:hypothetical protein